MKRVINLSRALYKKQFIKIVLFVCIGIISQSISAGGFDKGCFDDDWNKAKSVLKNEETLSKHIKNIESDDVVEQLILGLAYLKGHLVEEDYEKGMAFLKRAANQGSFAAQFLIVFYDPDTTEQQLETVLVDLAKKGSVFAQLTIGDKYIYEDVQKAKKWLSLATEQGCSEAEKKLARLN